MVDPRSPISVNEFEGVWNYVKNHPNSNLDEITNEELNSYKTDEYEPARTINVSYIKVLINHVLKDQKIE